MFNRSHVTIIFLLGICLSGFAQDGDGSIPSPGSGMEARSNRSQEAELSMDAGQDFHGKASYDDALRSYFYALEIYEELQDSSQIANTLTEIGQTYLRLSKNTEAGEVFNRALQISTNLNDKQGIQISMADVAVVLQRKDESRRAIQLYKKALGLAREVSNLKEEAIITGNIGSTYRRLAMYDSSVFYLKLALPLKVLIGNGASTAHTLNDIAETYLDQGDNINAVKYAQMALDTAGIAGAVSQGSFARYTLSRAYASQENYEAAYGYLNLHKQLYDSINSVVKDKAISDLRLKYETGKKEQQIAELAAENLIIQHRRRNMLFALLAVIILAISISFVLLTKRRHNLAMLAQTREVQRARSRFFTNISHEFRTPLTLILGPLHALREKFNGTETDSKLYGIQQNGQRLLRLIDRMLDLSRIDDHRLILKVSEVNAVVLLEEILTTIQHAAEQQSISLEFKPSDRSLPLYLDQDKFESIILNVLSNALKYTSAGGRISIRTNHIDDEWTNIEIEDTGAGIESEDLPHIFERYHYNDDKSRSNLKGVGVGLSLCKSLVELHGGTIEAKSQPGVGSTFIMRFRSGSKHLEERDDIIFSQADSMKPYSSINAGVKVGDLTTELPGEIAVDVEESNTNSDTLLVVEDRKDMRNFIKGILQTEFTIIEAADGMAGLELAQETIPDLIISDIMMPRLEGTELCAMLKKDTRTSHIPVILLTAKSSDQDRLAGLETEADVYLTKPFIPKELILNIRNLLASRQRIHEHFALNGKLIPSDISINSTDNKFLTNLTELLETHHADTSFSVEQLSEATHMSRSQLHRKLKALTGKTPSSVIRKFRLQRAFELVGASSGSISEIAFDVGFSSSSYFIKCFHKEFGVSPGEMKAEK